MYSASNWAECLLLDFKTQCLGITFFSKIQMCSFHPLEQSWYTACRMYSRESQGSFYVFTRGLQQPIKYLKSVLAWMKKITSGYLQSLKENDLI